MEDSAVRQLAEDHGRVWDVDAPADLADRLYSPEVEDHNPQPGQSAGREGVKQAIGLFHAVFPDLRVSNEDIIVSGTAQSFAGVRRELTRVISSASLRRTRASA